MNNTTKHHTEYSEQDNKNFIQKTVHLYKENEKLINIVSTAVLVIILLILAYIFYWAPKQHKKAELAIYKAEQYFAKDSLQLALNGDGTCDGLLTIIDKYSLTKTADRACFMAGVCFLKDGKYDEAIKYLKKYSAKDKLVSVQALGLIGDAYMEKNDLSSAASYYKKASKKNPNDMLTPIYLLRYGIVCEMQNKWSDALSAYETILHKYPQSYEAMDIEKRIEYAKTRK